MSDLDRARLHAALSGDTTALRELIGVMTPVVRARVARSLTRRLGHQHRSLAGEIADFSQEVFAALFSHDAKALRAWEPDRGLSFANYVGLLAQRRVVDIVRSRRWQSESEELELSESHLRAREPLTSEHEARSTSEDLLRRLLEQLEASLSVRGLEMFERLYVREQTIEEICTETGLSSVAVYQWRSRLAKAARHAMDVLEQEHQVEVDPRRVARARGGRTP